MTVFKSILTLSICFLSFFSLSCSQLEVIKEELSSKKIITTTVPEGEPAPIPLALGTWNDSPTLTGPKKIVVNIAQQRASFYKGDTLVGTTPVSTGIPGRGTPRGTYKVAEKDFVRYSGTFGVARDNKTHEIVINDFNTKKDSMPANCYYEPARMAYCLRFFNGYCWHEGYVPGVPASHGCVRVHSSMAKKFFEAATVGTTFIVK